VERIPEEALARFVRGVNLMPGTLAAQLGTTPTLLVFLRYFGCPFCKETISGLRAAVSGTPGYPPVLFFHQGSATEGRAFLRRSWPEARAVADPDMVFYDAFGVGRAGWREMLHPGSIPAMMRARAQGHTASDDGVASSDPRRMPGLFVVRGPQVVWAHRPRHTGDHPPFVRIPSLAGL
jgi:hypothetical protein